MRRKHMLSLFMLVLGVALLVAAMTVGAATSATQRTGKAGVSKGGTLRVNENERSDFDFVDPQLAYRTDDWSMLFTTAMQLVELPGEVRRRGQPVVSRRLRRRSRPSPRTGRPTRSTIRPGLKFSDGSPVTAAAYQRAWERILSPKMGSPLGVNLILQNTIVGGAAFLAGKAAHISGISAKGLTLSFHSGRSRTPRSSRSSRCSGSRPSSRTWRTRAQGLNTYPAAGPYYIASRDPGRSTVLKRNPYYKGNRPANPDQIVFTPNVNVDQSLLQVKAGQADIDLIGVPPTATADLGKQYGVNKGRFFVGATSCVNYMGMNNARAPFNNVAPRKAVNWAIDRPAQVRLLGAYAGKRTAQILVPGIPGYQDFNAYAIKGADPAKAKAIGGSAIASAPTLNVVHTTSSYSTNRAQVAEFNLKQVGFKINDVPTPATNYYQVIQTKGTSYNFVTNGGWCADYFDPYDYLNVLFDGRKIQASNNNNYTYFNNASYNAELDHAASLSGRSPRGGVRRSSIRN